MIHMSLRNPPKNMIFWRKIKLLLVHRMKNPMASRGKHNERIIQETKWPIIFFFPDDFGLSSPVIQKIFSPKKGIPLLS